MKYLKIILIFLIVFPFLEYAEANEKIILSIKHHDDDSEDYRLISSSGNEYNFIHALKSFYYLDIKMNHDESFLFSPIYLLKRYELLIVIKFNTSFYRRNLLTII